MVTFIVTKYVQDYSFVSKNRIVELIIPFFRRAQNSQSEKPNIIFQLVGGQVEIDNNMISIDDGVRRRPLTGFSRERIAQ